MRTIKLQDDLSNVHELESNMSEELLELWREFQIKSEDGYDYNELDSWLGILSNYGLTFDYGLDANIYDVTLTVN